LQLAVAAVAAARPLFFSRIVLNGFISRRLCLLYYINPSLHLYINNQQGLVY
jgi:hypothetical protein